MAEGLAKVLRWEGLSCCLRLGSNSHAISQITFEALRHARALPCVWLRSGRGGA